MRYVLFPLLLCACLFAGEVLAGEGDAKVLPLEILFFATPFVVLLLLVLTVALHVRLGRLRRALAGAGPE